MDIKSLGSGNVPFVVLKPYAAERSGLSIYLIKDGMFEPCKQTVSLMVAFLNSFIPGTITGTNSVDSKYSEQCPPVRCGTFTIKDAEWTARKYDCTILGGVFISYLQSYGVTTDCKAIAKVASDDKNYFEIVYPDFIGFFDTPRKTYPDQIEFLEGVQQNNSGLYTVLTVRGLEPNITVLMRQIAYLKRVFRFAAKTYIPFKKGIVRDNLVHSPESTAELESHGLLFAQRML